MNYEELVKALRHCVSDEKGVTKCAGCPYYPDITGCMDRLHTDAAAAIEDLQAEVKRMEDELSFSESSADEFQMQAALQNALLAKQVPHWVSVEDELPSEFQYVWAACKMNGRENWTIETVYDPYLSCPWGYDVPELRSDKAVVYAWMDRSAPEPPKEEK